MTLFKQIALLVSVSFLLLATVILFNDFSRTTIFLQGQLQTSAQDMSTTLGIAISNLPGGDDKASLEVLFNSVFDSGYYTKIELVDLDGNVIHQKSQFLKLDTVPDWFLAMVPLTEAQGVTRVVKGWVQLGELRLNLHPGFAYSGLYSIFKSTMVWSVILLAISILLLWIVLRYLLSPLQVIKQQADAIHNNQFVLQKELPNTVDLRRVVEAMNRMVEKVQGVFKDQQETLVRYQELLYRDKLTGLGNRRYLLEQLQQATSEGSSFHGCVGIIKIVNFEQVRESLGYKVSDNLVVQIASLLSLKNIQPDTDKLARLSNGEFAILMSTDEESLVEFIDEYFAEIKVSPEVMELMSECYLVAAVSALTTGVNPGKLLSNLDYSLTLATNQGPFSVWLERSSEIELPQGKIQWRSWLVDVIESNRLFLVGQTAFDHNLELAHRELFIRVLNLQGQVVSASAFMPMAANLGFASEIDKAVFGLVKALPGSAMDVPMALNLSSDFFEKIDVHESFDQLLVEFKLGNSRLCIEASHNVLIQHPKMGKLISERVHRHGHQFGIDNLDLGRSLDLLHANACDYVKINAATLQELSAEETSAGFKAIRTITETLEIDIIAVGVDSEMVFNDLKKLGIKFMQGNFLHKPETLDMGSANE